MIAPPHLMWIVLGILLFIGWILGALVWHVASFGIHALLILAIIAIILHFVWGHHRRSATGVT